MDLDLSNLCGNILIWIYLAKQLVLASDQRLNGGSTFEIKRKMKDYIIFSIL